MGVSLVWVCLLGCVECVHGSQGNLVGTGIGQEMLEDPWESGASGGGSGRSRHYECCSAKMELRVSEAERYSVEAKESKAAATAQEIIMISASCCAKAA